MEKRGGILNAHSFLQTQQSTTLAKDKNFSRGTYLHKHLIHSLNYLYLISPVNCVAPLASTSWTLLPVFFRAALILAAEALIAGRSCSGGTVQSACTLHRRDIGTRKIEMRCRNRPVAVKFFLTAPRRRHASILIETRTYIQQISYDDRLCFKNHTAKTTKRCVRLSQETFKSSSIESPFYGNTASVLSRAVTVTPTRCNSLNIQSLFLLMLK